MPKISRPVVYTALAAVAAYALFLNTQPPSPTTVRRVSHTTRTLPDADPNGILPEDLRAHFARYVGGKRDPFVPGVLLARRDSAAASADRAQLGWALTGISAVNGVSSALLENSATGESVFLQPGDRWSGMRVLSIRPDRVVFLNALGREDTLTFAAPPDDTAGTGGRVSVPGAPRLPGGVASLSPYPVTPLQVTPFTRQGQSLPVLPPLGGNAASGFGGGNAPSQQDDNSAPPDDNGPPNGFPFGFGPPGDDQQQ